MTTPDTVSAVPMSDNDRDELQAIGQAGRDFIARRRAAIVRIYDDGNGASLREIGRELRMHPTSVRKILIAAREQAADQDDLEA